MGHRINFKMFQILLMLYNYILVILYLAISNTCKAIRVILKYFFFVFFCKIQIMIFHIIDDGQPEDIGYGYQKNLRNLENMFEQGTPSNKISKDEIIEKYLNYLAKENSPQYNKKNLSKKSIFREREDSDTPENLQQLKYDRYAMPMPSAFRERYQTNPGIVQDYKNNMEEQDNYLYAINSLLDKYIEENVQDMSDEELENLLRSQEEKRNIPEEYQDLYNPYPKRTGNPMERQFIFIPTYQARKHHKNQNRWMKPRLMKRSKKNISSNESHTDPKVAAELNNIFLGSESNNSNANITKEIFNNVNKTLKLEKDNTKIHLKKKSIDWSNYFGYDRKYII